MTGNSAVFGIDQQIEWSFSEEPILSRRNFDPESRTLRKRTRNDDEDLEDTVEKNVAGLAEQIVAEDEETRAQDLVRYPFYHIFL